MELANSLSKPPYRKTVITVIEEIQADSNTTIVPFSSEGMSKAFSLFKSRGIRLGAWLIAFRLWL